MPLKDRDRTRPRRLVRLGIIRLGHKEKSSRSGREYPVQDDHFVLTDAPALVAVYGETPHEIDVTLAFPEIRRNFDAWYQVWAGGILICKGDGDFVDYASPFTVEQKGNRAIVHRAPGDTLVNNGVAQQGLDWNGQHFDEGDTVPCPGAAQDLYPHCKTCRKSAVLKVMMVDPDLVRLGYYQIATGSGRNYDTINGMLEWVRDAIHQVNGIRYHLRLVQEATSYLDDSGERKATTRHFLQLEPFPEDLKWMMQKRRTSLLDLPPQPIAALTGEIEDEYLEADDEAPPPFAEGDAPAEEPEPEPESEPEQEPDPGPEPESNLPVNWPAFARKAVAELGYKDIAHVGGALKAAGYKEIVNIVSDCDFNVAEGWAVLQGAMEVA